MCLPYPVQSRYHTSCTGYGIIPSMNKQRGNLTTTCPACGQEFRYYASWPRKFCSRACAGKTSIRNIPKFQASRYTATCEQCGKRYETTPGVTRGRFCSRTCYGKWLSAHNVGSAHPRHGRKVGRHSYLPPATMKTCPICGTDFAVKPSHTARRRFCSKECQWVWQAESARGEANFHWRGGYEPYYGPTWLAAQRTVRARDKVCQMCGKTPEENGAALDVHHVKPFRLFGVTRHQEANDLSNLTALCHQCHSNIP